MSLESYQEPSRALVAGISLDASAARSAVSVTQVETPAEARRALDEGPLPEICVLQAGWSDEDLDSCTRAMRARDARVPVLFVVDDDKIPAVLRALRLGADGIISPPLSGPVVMRRVEREVLAARHLASTAGPAELDVQELVAESSAMEDVLRLVVLGAASSASVVLQGDSGTGKELLARLFHRLSPRRRHPFVVVRCGAIPHTLLDGELLGVASSPGHDVEEARHGLLEQAEGGTLFLDGIADLPEASQARLLRVLQDGTYEPLGSRTSQPVDVRIIASTRLPLEDEVAAGRFREDLLYRLKVLSVTVPPLSSRHRDIVPLWNQFVSRIAAAEDRGTLRTHPAVLPLLLKHPWPGNVRELENAAKYASTLARGDIVEAAHLPQGLTETREVNPSALRVPPVTMKELEQAAILQAYAATGSAQKTAEVLGVSVRKIQYRLKSYRAAGVLDEATLIAPEKSPRRDRLVGPKVLVAVEDPALRELIDGFLSAEGFVVEALSSGSELSKRLATLLRAPVAGRPHVLLTDLPLDGLDGLKLLSGARDDGWSLPAVVVSSFDDAETRAFARDAGVAAFVDKPIDLVELYRVVDALLPSDGLHPGEQHRSSPS